MSAKKRVVGIALLTGLAVLGDAMLLIVVPIYWEDFGLTALWQIGVILSMNRFIRLPINPLVGWFYERFQIRTGLWIAMSLGVLSTFLYGVSQSFLFLVLLRAVWGIAWSLLRLGGFLTIIEVASNENRGQFVGLYNGLWGLGGFVGMLGGGILVDQTSIFFVTTLFASLGLLGFPLIAAFVPKAVKNKTTGSDTQPKRGKIFSPYVWMVLSTGFTVGFIVFGLLASTISQLVDRSYTAEWNMFGIAIGAATLAGFIQAIKWAWDPFVASYFGKKLDETKNPIKLLITVLISGGFLSLLLSSVQIFLLLFIILLLFQLTSTMFITATDTLASNAAAQSNHSVKIMTAHTVVVDVGAAIGPLLSYLIIEFSSITIAYIVGSIAMFGLGIAWSYFRNRSLGIR